MINNPNDFLLGRQWLEDYVERLTEEDLSEEQITEKVNEWVLAVVKYITWLQDEGIGCDLMVAN